MKILSFGDSPKVNTGYGYLYRYMLAYASSLGHEVIHVSYNHSEPIEKITSDREGHSYSLFPAYIGSGGFVAAADTVKSIIPSYKPDIVFTANDYFASYFLPDIKLAAYANRQPFPLYLSYSIIDGPDHALSVNKIIAFIDKPIVATKYAYNQVIKYNPNTEIIPHGYDNNFFYQRDSDKINDIKKSLGLANRFVIGASNRNVIRKHFASMLRIYSEFKKEQNAKDAILFMLCDPRDSAGHQLYTWAKRYNLKVANNPESVNEDTDILFHPKYISALVNLTIEELAQAYNTFDIHFSTSVAEGFGLTTLETMACGVPNVILNNTANTELVQGRGWLYSTAKNIDGSDVLLPGVGNTIYTTQMIDAASAKIALTDAYKSANKRQAYSKKCLEFVKDFTWPAILPQWKKVLDEISEVIA